MTSTTFLFYAFAAVLLFAAFRVVTARSTVHSALFLVLAFFSGASLWMLLRAEFLAIVLVLVYVGAVMVLFLFVVMMLDIDSDRFRAGFWKQLPTAGFVGALIALEMALVLMRGFQLEAPAASAQALAVGNTRLLGIELYTDYLYPLQLAAVLLLVAIVAAIALTLRGRKDSRHLSPSQQVRVTKRERLRIVKMAPEAAPRSDEPARDAASSDAAVAPPPGGSAR